MTTDVGCSAVSGRTVETLLGIGLVLTPLCVGSRKHGHQLLELCVGEEVAEGLPHHLDPFPCEPARHIFPRFGDGRYVFIKAHGHTSQQVVLGFCPTLLLLAPIRIAIDAPNQAFVLWLFVSLFEVMAEVYPQCVWVLCLGYDFCPLREEFLCFGSPVYQCRSPQ